MKIKFLILSMAFFLHSHFSSAQKIKIEDQGPEVGSMFPDFEYETLDGEKVALGSYSDKVVVINTWFVGCSGCKVEEPYLAKLTEEYKDNDSVVFIALAMSSPNKIQRYLERNGDYGYLQVSVPRKEILEKYRVVISPSHFIVKDGVLVAKYIGSPMVPHYSNLELFREEIEKAVKE
ncbi:redoxin domain-containing protein [Belliella sp. DSM 107340]|uniref:Redoxin domain-containing protein n=1 Tax=Belliella calami TaxID=2923436 RepID=A0ABS9UQ58_9BACT|nr:TlpA disulfide reductase family protein [Belliella calami]MCH7398766.1 redoxin domain-containing protein [Belliella calami]